MSEDRETREKRLRIRSWRRGIREMDMILGPFADDRLGALDGPALDLYEVLLAENDHDLYRWVSGADAAPDRFAPLIEVIRAHAHALHGRG